MTMKVMDTNCYSRDRKFAVNFELNWRCHRSTCIQQYI